MKCRKWAGLLCIPAAPTFVVNTRSKAQTWEKHLNSLWDGKRSPQQPAPPPSLLIRVSWSLKGFFSALWHLSLSLKAPHHCRGLLDGCSQSAVSPVALHSPEHGDWCSQCPCSPETQTRCWQPGFNHARADNHQTPLISNKLSNPDACRIWVNTAPNRIIKQISTKRFRVSAPPSPSPAPSNGEKCKSGDPAFVFETRSVPMGSHKRPPHRAGRVWMAGMLGKKGNSHSSWQEQWSQLRTEQPGGIYRCCCLPVSGRALQNLAGTPTQPLSHMEGCSTCVLWHCCPAANTLAAQANPTASPQQEERVVCRWKGAESISGLHGLCVQAAACNLPAQGGRHGTVLLAHRGWVASEITQAGFSKAEERLKLMCLEGSAHRYEWRSMVLALWIGSGNGNRSYSISGQEVDPILCTSPFRLQFCKGCDLERHTRVYV